MPRIFLTFALVVSSALSGSAVRQGGADSVARAAQLLGHGQRADAERIARAHTGDPAAAVILAQLAADRGQYAGAQALLTPIAATDPLGEAALQLALIDQTLGRRDEATNMLTAIAGQHGTSAAALFRAARAAHALNQTESAKALYLAAERAGADVVPLETAFGRLFLEKYNLPEAGKSFQRVIDADPDWAPAYAGLAQVLADDKPKEAAAAAQKAISIDPSLPEPHLFLASGDLDADHQPEARAEIDKVLAVNPSNLAAHSLLAGMAYVKDDHAGYNQEVAAVQQVNPHDAEIYRITGDQAASHYRFADAASLAQKALDVDPSDTQAAEDLGMHLMRTGDEAGAKRALDRAWDGDRYNIVTFNLLHLLDVLGTFQVITDGEFIFKMDPAEAPVLKEYAVPLAHEAMKDLSARYGFTPAGPILIEIFPKHDDFAVRNLGLPGMVGALGACFGHVVTLDSPTARPPGMFSWESALWHELTHVVTLQMSQQRIPRWLTEGISVYEEGRHRAEWGRDMDVTFARAMDQGKVMKLRDLNAGFTRAETISLAYYEASLLVDHIVKAKGIDALRTLVRSYATGIDTPTAIQGALGESIDELQTSFDRALDEEFGTMKRALHDVDKPVTAGSLMALKADAAAHPESYISQIALGEALVKASDPDAYAPLERAAALVPSAVGEESPHALMANLAEKLNDRPRTLKEFEALLAADHTNVGAAQHLADLAKAAGDDRLRELALLRVVSINPFDASAHVALGEFELRKKDAPLAARELRAALASGAPDKAVVHCDLGESYLLAGDAAAAKKEALAAIELAPGLERAQDLLLRAR